MDVAAVNDFDLFSLPDHFFADPYPIYRSLQISSPHHILRDGSLLLTRYNDLIAVYRDTETWSSDKKLDFKAKLGGTALYEHHTNSLVFRDPPDHTRIRNLFQAAFTRKALLALRPRVEDLVEGYLDEFETTREFDIVSAFTFRLPVDVISDMLGAPTTDRLLIRDWSKLILGGLEPVLSDEQLSSGHAAVEEFKRYLRDLIAFRAANPTDGRSGEVLSALIAAEEQGQRLTELELLHQCIFLLNAGHETTANMLSHGVHELLCNHEQLDRLRNDSALIDSCIEEVLRYQAPIQINNRRSVKPAEIDGKAVPAGTFVHLMIGAANRDPSQFTDPDRFDISRRPNRHLSFGLGIHICAGNSLARMEGAIALSKLVKRFPNIELAGTPTISKRVRFREISNLPIRV